MAQAIFCKKIRIFHKKHLENGHKIKIDAFRFLFFVCTKIVLYRHLKVDFYVWIFVCQRCFSIGDLSDCIGRNAFEAIKHFCKVIASITLWLKIHTYKKEKSDEKRDHRRKKQHKNDVIIIKCALSYTYLFSSRRSNNPSIKFGESSVAC